METAGVNDASEDPNENIRLKVTYNSETGKYSVERVSEEEYSNATNDGKTNMVQMTSYKIGGDGDGKKPASKGGESNIMPGPQKDNIKLPESITRLKELMEKGKVGELAETGGTATDWAAKAANIGGLDKAAEILEKANKVFTIVSAVDNLLKRKYFEALKRGISLIGRASPYVFAYDTFTGVMNSDFTLNQAAWSSDRACNNYLLMARKAKLDLDDGLANEYINQVKLYSRLRDQAMSQMNSKE
jgi:hypothetical protein